MNISRALFTMQLFTISMREDVGHVALRPHLRYVAPLAIPLLYLFMKLGQSLAAILFTSFATIGASSGFGYRIAAMCSFALCLLAALLMTSYDEKKVMGLLGVKKG